MNTPLQAHRTWHALILIGLSVGAAQPMTAQGWSLLPGGEAAYSHTLQTGGAFRCLSQQYYLAGGSCAVSGNALTLTSGSSSMTVSFTGTTQTVVATNARDTPITLGQLFTTFTGDPFTLPPMASVNAPLFVFELLLSSPSPRPASGLMQFSYTSRTGTSLPFDCCDVRSYFVMPITAPPSPFTYGSAVYDTFQGVDLTFTPGSQDVTARVGLVPEPATYALLVSGLLVLAGVGRARRVRDR